MAARRDEQAMRVLAGYLGLTDAQETSLLPTLYTPDNVAPLLAQMEPVVQRKRAGELDKAEAQELGYMLEDLALLVFQSFAGLDTLLSYKSVDAQLDLVVSGSDMLWKEITKIIGIKEYSSVLVEAKAWSGKAGVAEVLRLGSLLSHHCRQTSGVAVLFTLEGASGFPTPDKPEPTLRDARATQVILYHATGKPIVVFDWDDIKTLSQAGSLVTMLRRKIQEIELNIGKPTPLPSEPVEVLPERLKKLRRTDLGGTV